MLDTVTAPAREMAGTARVTAGFPDLLRNFGDVDALDDLAGSRGHLRVLDDRIACETWWLLVNAGGVVAREAVDVFL